MRFDTDLARTILLAVEATPPNKFADVKVANYDEASVLEHVELLADHGLLVAKIARSGMGSDRILTALIERLTWEGHQFLANARNEQAWARTKQMVRDKGGSVSFEVLKTLLSKAVLDLFGLANGS